MRATVVFKETKRGAPYVEVVTAGQQLLFPLFVSAMVPPPRESNVFAIRGGKSWR